MLSAVEANKRIGAGTALLLALTLRGALLLYWMARYSGYWSEGDTSRTTATILAVFDSGRLLSSTGRVYPAGFLFQATSAFSLLLTGLNVTEWQNWVYPIYSLVVIGLAFVLYYRTLGQPVAAGLAAVMLSLQGDFVFTTTRGTHEKLSYALVMVSLLAMLLALTAFDTWRKRLAVGAVYYLAVFALSNANVFFASTFTINLALAFLVWSSLSRRVKWMQGVPVWLSYIALVCVVFIFLVIFYLYPPARGNVEEAKNLWERVGLFLLSLDEPQAVVYVTASQTWVFPQAWWVLRMFDFFLIGLAALGWVGSVYRLRQARAVVEPPMPAGVFWWLILFPAFVTLNFIFILSDVTGSAGEISNLQVRLVPLTALAAAPLATHVLMRILAWQPGRVRLWTVRVVVVVACVIFTSTALIKGFSEPLLSNAWMFYRPSEQMGIRWLNERMPLLTVAGGTRTPRVWVGVDFRLGGMWLDLYWQGARQLVPVANSLSDQYTYALLSPVVRARLERLRRTLPDIENKHLIYDNGEAQIFYFPQGQK